MRRLLVIVMCGAVALSVGGCARRERAERRETAEASNYPPPPARSPMAQIEPGMREPQVMKILGPPDDSRAYITGKAFIPWYFGPDRSRFVGYWRGKGRVIFMGGNQWGGGAGKVVRVEYDPSEDGDSATK
jgi:hypothetical protein